MYAIGNSYNKQFFSFWFFSRLIGGIPKDQTQLLLCKFGWPTSPNADDYTKKKDKILYT